jgi:hypothetical protein
MLHKSTKERYEKLKKIFIRLKARFDRDDLDEFIQVANSLPAWIKGDMTMTQAQLAALEAFTVPESVDWQICNQIANQQKHFHPLRPRSRERLAESGLDVKDVITAPNGPGFVLPESARIIGAGEEITILFGDGRESALAFVIRVFGHFHYIFEIAPLAPEDRDPKGQMPAILAL